MLSNPAYASYLRNFYKTKHKEKLSKPALESMAIIAYKQPVTRSDIELIRGVNSDGVVTNLLEKELIKVVGRKDIPGRPYVYGTTKQFLEYFGLKSLDDLPVLEEFPTLQPPEESDRIEESEPSPETENPNEGKAKTGEGITASENVAGEIIEGTEEKAVHDESEKFA
jgi:segregation and condensation protein B